MCDDGVDEVGGCKCEERKEKRKGICQVGQILLNNTMGLDWRLLREARRSCCEHSGRNVVREQVRQVGQPPLGRGCSCLPSMCSRPEGTIHHVPNIWEVPTPGRYPPKYPSRAGRYATAQRRPYVLQLPQAKPSRKMERKHCSTGGRGDRCTWATGKLAQK